MHGEIHSYVGHNPAVFMCGFDPERIKENPWSPLQIVTSFVHYVNGIQKGTATASGYSRGV